MVAAVDTGGRFRRVTVPLGTGVRARSDLEVVIGAPPIVVSPEVGEVTSRLVDDLAFVTLNGTSARGAWSLALPRIDVSTFRFLMDLWNDGPTAIPEADLEVHLAHLRPKTYLAYYARAVAVVVPLMVLSTSAWAAELPMVPRALLNAASFGVPVLVLALPPGPVTSERAPATSSDPPAAPPAPPRAAPRRSRAPRPGRSRRVG